MKSIILSFLFCLFNVVLIAQTKDVDVDVNVGDNGGGGLWTSWYVWAGLVVLLLLVIVSISGRRRAD